MKGEKRKVYVLQGVYEKVEQDLWAGKMICPRCEEEHDFHLARLVRVATVFFVPIMSRTVKRYLVCDSCEYFRELKRKEFKQLKSERFELLENGGFPTEIVRNDCHPDRVKFKTRIFKIILSAILSLIMLFIVVVSLTDRDFYNMIPMFLIAFVIFSIPLLLSIKNFLPALKMRKFYNFLNRPFYS